MSLLFQIFSSWLRCSVTQALASWVIAAEVPSTLCKMDVHLCTRSGSHFCYCEQSHPQSAVLWPSPLIISGYWRLVVNVLTVSAEVMFLECSSSFRCQKCKKNITLQINHQVHHVQLILVWIPRHPHFKLLNLQVPSAFTVNGISCSFKLLVQ